MSPRGAKPARVAGNLKAWSPVLACRGSLPSSAAPTGWALLSFLLCWFYPFQSGWERFCWCQVLRHRGLHSQGCELRREVLDPQPFLSALLLLICSDGQSAHGHT